MKRIGGQAAHPCTNEEVALRRATNGVVDTAFRGEGVRHSGMEARATHINFYRA